MRATPLPRHPYAQASSVEPSRLIHWMLQQNDPIRPTLSSVAMRWRGQRCLRYPQHLPRGTAQYARMKLMVGASVQGDVCGDRRRRRRRRCCCCCCCCSCWFGAEVSFFGLCSLARARTPACVRACMWWDRRSHVELPAVRMLARLRSDPRSPEIIDKERSASRKHRCVCGSVGCTIVTFNRTCSAFRSSLELAAHASKHFSRRIVDYYAPPGQNEKRIIGIVASAPFWVSKCTNNKIQPTFPNNE